MPNTFEVYLIQEARIDLVADTHGNEFMLLNLKVNGRDLKFACCPHFAASLGQALKLQCREAAERN